MTNPVIPPSISPLPAAPAPTDTEIEFNDKAFPLVAAQVNMVAELNAANAATHTNAVAALESAEIAVPAKKTAAAAAQTAVTKAGEASTSATQAETSRIEASKLNLGPKNTPPTTDNQGEPLLAGATYYDTTLNQWRVWNGTEWTQGVSAVAGVSEVNGETGVVTLTAEKVGAAPENTILARIYAGALCF